MKKAILFSIMVFYFACNLQAQNSGSLTNSVIVKMVKAKLSDEIIIEEINNSNVNFNMSQDSIDYLSGVLVSDQVIQVMKMANERQHPAKILTTETKEIENPLPIAKTDSVAEQTKISSLPIIIQEKDTVVKTTQPKPAIVKEEIYIPATDQDKETETTSVQNQKVTKTETTKELIKTSVSKSEVNKDYIEKSTVSVEAVSYVIPMEELVSFFNNEFDAMVKVIQSYNIRVKDSISKINQTKETISQIESELTEKKNADAKTYSENIILLKKKLAAQRIKYNRHKANMHTDGLNIIRSLKETSERINSKIASKFNDVSSKIKDTDSDPAKGRITKAITISNQKFNSPIVDYIKCATEIPVFFQNEVTILQNIIIQWSEKAEATINKDAELIKQKEPLDKELAILKSDSKKNKDAINDLKKKISLIDKERKKLKNQMDADSKELASLLKQNCKEIQISFEARITDIIENMTFQYQDKFNL